MDDNKNTTTNLPNQDVHQDEDEDEEALSLTGLILNLSKVELELQHPGRSSSSADHFEFLLDRNSEMSHAEDIISCGKLIPYKERRPHTHTRDHRKNRHFLKSPADDQKKHSFHSRRSESLNDIRTTGRSNSAVMRNSRSLDYGKLYGSRSSYRWMENLENERSSSSTKSGSSGAGGGGRFDPTKEKIAPTPRLRWYMMFGSLKFPPEMDFQDIKSRQVRRNNNPSGDGKALVNRVRCSSSWHLLRVLSCKDHASVAVTTPFGCLQQI